ncbi:hypothetical protein [Desulforhopalus singaporensis]|uniref:Uncharacterized protein n=1 Tax=Desulforhopalus singaporensis TaxID=91360 RepID=A0A1H0SJ84_9BACT|nr:hypothetical protein [Desulforhopalus singaporensis]SDP41777.1 hypothetical protein SAMN05660330_02703 [Desulforhopalus singaporensis]
MIYDSWVLTGFASCNVLLVAMTVIAYIYQSIRDRGPQDDDSSGCKT